MSPIWIWINSCNVNLKRKFDTFMSFFHGFSFLDSFSKTTIVAITICSSLLECFQNGNSHELHCEIEYHLYCNAMVNKIYVAVSLPGLRLNCLESWLIHTNYASKPCWFPASSLLDAACVSQASKADWIFPTESLLDTKSRNIAECLKLTAKHFKIQESKTQRILMLVLKRAWPE